MSEEELGVFMVLNESAKGMTVRDESLEPVSSSEESNVS